MNISRLGLVPFIKIFYFRIGSFGMRGTCRNPERPSELHQRHDERAPLQVLHRVRVRDRLRRRGQDRTDV